MKFFANRTCPLKGYHIYWAPVLSLTPTLPVALQEHSPGCTSLVWYCLQVSVVLKAVVDGWYAVGGVDGAITERGCSSHSTKHVMGVKFTSPR